MWRKILCEFHEETNPSASVSDTGGYVCFACGIRGPLLELLEKTMSHDRAIERYKELTGAEDSEIPQSARGQSGRGISVRTPDWERGANLFPDWFREGA